MASAARAGKKFFFFVILCVCVCMCLACSVGGGMLFPNFEQMTCTQCTLPTYFYFIQLKAEIITFTFPWIGQECPIREVLVSKTSSICKCLAERKWDLPVNHMTSKNEKLHKDTAEIHTSYLRAFWSLFAPRDAGKPESLTIAFCWGGIFSLVWCGLLRKGAAAGF